VQRREIIEEEILRDRKPDVAQPSEKSIVKIHMNAGFDVILILNELLSNNQGNGQSKVSKVNHALLLQ
jgi:hypothetical protein